jgi:hypothetical protein
MTSDTNATDWIGVTEVAKEMGWSERQAYEEIRALGVPCRGRGLRGLRFRRSDYVERRDASLAPLDPRKAYSRPGIAEGTAPKPDAAPVTRRSALRRSRLRGPA